MIPVSEVDLESELLRLYQEGAALGYRASRFYQLFMPHCKHYIGGVKAVQHVLRNSSRTPTGGFQFIRKNARLDMAVENIVLDERWAHLFGAEDRAIARQNLERHSQQPTPTA